MYALADSSTAVTVGTEVTVLTVTGPRTVRATFDLSNLAAGDAVELRVETQVNGTYRTAALGVYAGAQGADGAAVQTPPVDVAASARVKIKQTAGTARTFGYQVHDLTPGMDANGRVGVQVGTGAGQINSGGGKVPATVAAGDAADLTATRLAKVDRLPASGTVATSSDIDAINQSASRRWTLATLAAYELPESGTTLYPVELRTFDGDGVPVNASGTPTLAAANTAGTSRTANLSAATNPATGVYRWTYSVGTAHAQEPLEFTASGTLPDAVTIAARVFGQVVDAVAVDFTASDRTKLQALYDMRPTGATYLAGAAAVDGKPALPAAYDAAKTAAQAGDAMALTAGERTTLAGVVDGSANSAAAATNAATALARLGAFTGTGLNTVLGFLRALGRKDAALTPSDMGGTFDNATDSLEAAQAAIAAAVAPTPAEIWGEPGVVDGKSPADALAIVAAATAGKLSGAGTGTETMKGLDGATDRLVSTVDQDGNRTGVAYP